MFLLGGNQNFSTAYVNSSHIVVIWIKTACRTVIFVQSRLGRKSKSCLFLMGKSFLRGQCIGMFTSQMSEHMVICSLPDSKKS